MIRVVKNHWLCFGEVSPRHVSLDLNHFLNSREPYQQQSPSWCYAVACCQYKVRRHVVAVVDGRGLERGYWTGRVGKPPDRTYTN